MKRTNKKAFTIVELVIVIAVVAILAAVLIPTFTSIVRKANVSADVQLIRNLNTALSVDRATGKEHNTMQDALDAAYNAGYIVTVIDAKASENKILWDSKNDLFCYLEKDASKPSYHPESSPKHSVNNVDLWEIVEEIPTTQRYSIYLVGESYDKEVVISVGFDAGDNTLIPTISYDRTEETAAQEVVIRTNGDSTVLSVSAPKDIINHYGKAGLIDVIAVDMNSYHENGEVSTIRVSSGRVVVESVATANVSSVLIVAAAENKPNEGVKVEINNNQETPVKINKDNNVLDDKIIEIKNNNEVVMPTVAIEVSTLDELKAAINGPVDGVTYDTIFITSDLDLELSSNNNCGIKINRPISIFGNGHKLVNNEEGLPDDTRLINICDMQNGIVVLDNISFESSTYSNYMRGINIFSTEEVSIQMKKVKVFIPHYYAINIALGNVGLKISMEECEVRGWSTINNWSDEVTIMATECRFDAVNPELAGGANNSFSNIVVSQYYGSKGTEQKNNDFTFINCEFTADKRNPDADVNQIICDLRSPMNNIVKFTNCKFEKCASPKYIHVVYSDDEYGAPKENNGSNKVFIDGIDVTYSSDFIEVDTW